MIHQKLGHPLTLAGQFLMQTRSRIDFSQRLEGTCTRRFIQRQSAIRHWQRRGRNQLVIAGVVTVDRNLGKNVVG